MATKIAAGTGLKEQIYDHAETIERELRTVLLHDLQKDNITLEEILGELVWPFIGVDAPAYFSFTEDAPASGSDIVVQDIIVHFSNKANLKDWNDTYHGEILTTLHHLLKMIETIRKRNDVLYHIANLYQLKRIERTPAVLDDLLRYYVGPVKKA